VQVSSILQNLGSFIRATPGSAAAPPPAPRPEGPELSRVDLLTARRQLLRVLESFEEIDRLVNGAQSTILSGLPSARSDPALALNLTATAAMLNSVDEINATPTSFSPFVPAWGGALSALLNIDGIYDGTNGSGAVSFEVRRAGVHGVDRLRVRVRDPLGNIMTNVTIRENHPLDRQYNLGNGLFFTLGAGSLANSDTTSIQVFDNIGSVVDLDKPLNGTGNDKPNLQFGMPGVVDGSFQLNGVTIAVSADGSVNDMLNVINQSGAGVTASFNPATERIELTQNSPGSANTIDIQGDDSNFVQATKLDTAAVVPGIDPDTERPLESVTQFSAVQSGSFVINGTSIAVDAQNDSLNDVIDRINASGADVVASFDPATQRAVITGENPGENLIIDANGTGIFGALNMPEGQVDRLARGRGYSAGRSRRIADAIENSVAALNDFFRETKAFGAENPKVASLRSQLKAGFTSVLGLAADGGGNTGLGIDFDLDGVGKRYQRFAYIDRGELIRGLRTRGADIQQFLNGGEERTGLIQAVGAAAQRTLLSLNSTLGTKGSLFDGYA